MTGNKQSTLLIIFFWMFAIINGYAQTAHKTVTAQKGDGIYSILRNNRLDPVKYYEEFVALNKSKLGKNNGLYSGQSYLLPIPKEENVVEETPETVLKDSLSPPKPIIKTPAKRVVNYDIFGADYRAVTIESDQLKGSVYYLVSGHGGPDPGATEKFNGQTISEDEYAYDVTLRLARKLIEQGAKVYMIIKDKNDGIRDTRILKLDTDEVNHPNKKIPRSQKQRLRQRTETVNELFKQHRGMYQRLIVTHVDSRSKGENIDVFFYHDERSSKGRQLARQLQLTFREKYARYQPNRIYTGTVTTRNLYMVRKTIPPMVYIEIGNIKSKKDQRRILDPENRDALAKWIGEGVIKDHNNTKSD